MRKSYHSDFASTLRIILSAHFIKNTFIIRETSTGAWSVEENNSQLAIELALYARNNFNARQKLELHPANSIRFPLSHNRRNITILLENFQSYSKTLCD